MTFTQLLAAVWLVWGITIYLSIAQAVHHARVSGKTEVVNLRVDLRGWLLLGVILAVAVLL